MAEEQKHKNDIYGNVDDPRNVKEEAPAIPAATVVLLRDADAGPEILMLRKNSKIAFGGMWVFPGGRIDDEDFVNGVSEEETARNDAARVAAARESKEEAGIDLDTDAFVWFAHWTPPPSTPKRFATWFYAARATEQTIEIDGGEIEDHRWIRAADALARHTAGEIDLVPPTWITLYHISRYDSVDAVLERFRSNDPRYYSTRVVKNKDGIRVAMWAGDAGYDDWDADVEGSRHRLVMPESGFTFENDTVNY